ncbi:hypothetical protein LVA97_32365, partial [Klebsiella pneumoniae]|uniref:hypothetical protein n=1 Tax=Klebsiella pneumoniae TaxID=573 RepID=UPI001E4AD8D2
MSFPTDVGCSANLNFVFILCSITVTDLFTHFLVEVVTYGKYKQATRSGNENIVRRHRAAWSNS